MNKFEIKILTESCAKDYDNLLLKSPNSMFNHSLKYRNFLKSFISHTRDVYLLAYENDELVAALPLFVKESTLGKVINSLPFYGSHGGLIYAEQASDLAKQSLLDKYKELCSENDVLSATLVESPLGGGSLYHCLEAEFTDVRVGQITYLPSSSTEEEAEEELMKMFHQKTRNMVRKALKSQFQISHDASINTMIALSDLHAENMSAIGGLAKPWQVFESIHNTFSYGEDYRIYLAKSENDEIAAALLVFYYKDTVEYFTPVTNSQYRQQQPLSALIFKAMTDAVMQYKASKWNWGGTWKSQEGVYRFKSRWGAKDIDYHYYINATDKTPQLCSLSQETILEEFKYFYTVPFSQLKAKD